MCTMSEPADIQINLHGQFGYQVVHVHTSEVLGTGAYGSVVKATLDHLPCAAKILHSLIIQSDDPGAVTFAARFDQECHIMRELKHPCVVQFLGVVQDPKSRRPILLMELMEDSLTGFLERTAVSLPFHIQVNITYDIALALVYLHGKNIIHRDLSSNNILLNNGNRAKVTDFGMSRMVDANPRMTRSQLTHCPGTPYYMPPEALLATPLYSDKLDTFSLGVLIIQIITRTYPAPTNAQITMEDSSSPTGIKIIPVPELERRKNDIDKVPSDHVLLPIAHHCLKDRDKERPTAAQLCHSLEKLKATQPYTASATENQQTRAIFEQQLRLKEEEKAAEIARLQEQMRQLAMEKEKEVADLRYQMQTSHRAPAHRKVQCAVKRVSKSEVSCRAL